MLGNLLAQTSRMEVFSKFCMYNPVGEVAKCNVIPNKCYVIRNSDLLEKKPE